MNSPSYKLLNVYGFNFGMQTATRSMSYTGAEVLLQWFSSRAWRR